MSVGRSNLGHTSHLTSSPKTPKIAYLLAFVVSSLLSYWWAAAGRPMGAAKKDYAATAVIRIHGPALADRGGAAIGPNLDANIVRQKALRKRTSIAPRGRSAA